MNDELEEPVKSWLIIAGRDLQAAENQMLIRGRHFVAESACFFAQQSVEKYLKAYLTKHLISFGKTHSIEYLLKVCMNVDSDFKNISSGNLPFMQ